jgi:hypothetical protein
MNNNEDMKKLLILLLLIPTVSFGKGFDFKKALDNGYTCFEISNYLKTDKFDKSTYNELKKICPQSQIEEDKKTIRLNCAYESEIGKTDFTAKKIYETCLDKKGIEDK